jgi:MFS family permease
MGSVLAAAPVRVRYRDALAVGEFRALLAASLVSVTGSVVAAVALTVLVYERTGSPFLASLAFALGFLPYVVSGMLLSALVDRLPARRLLSWSSFGCALLVLPMALPATPTAALLLLLLAVGTVSSVANGARAGVVRTVVGDLAFVPARSLLRISAQVAQIGGNGVGGLLLVVLSPRGLILANAVSFGVAGLLTRLGLRERPAEAVGVQTPLLRDSLRTAREVVSDREVRRLLLLGWLVPAFAVWPEALAAPYVFSEGHSRALVGWWLVALPLGVVLGDLLGVWLLSPWQQQRLVAPIAALGFAPFLAFVVQPSVAVALPLLVCGGMGAAYGLGLDSLYRDRVRRDLFARTMAISTAGLMTVQGLGFAAAGAVAQWLAPAYVIALAGVLGLLAVAALRPRA